jgi:hypothetical protein
LITRLTLSCTSQEHNCVRELRGVVQQQQGKISELQMELNELRLQHNELRHDLRVVKVPSCFFHVRSTVLLKHHALLRMYR